MHVQVAFLRVRVCVSVSATNVDLQPNGVSVKTCEHISKVFLKIRLTDVEILNEIRFICGKATPKISKISTDTRNMCFGHFRSY